MLTHGREHFETAPLTTGLKRLPYQELSTANKTSLWKARQFADRYCCSYDYFISTRSFRSCTTSVGQVAAPTAFMAARTD